MQRDPAALRVTPVVGAKTGSVGGVATPVDAGQAAATPGTVATPAFVPATVACGGKLCDAKKEMCCGTESAGACAPRRNPKKGVALAPQDAAAQFAACEAADAGGADLVHCDDSGDCADNEVCCDSWFSSDRGHRACITASQAGANVCDFSEVCVVGQPCKTSGTVCAGGTCQLPNRVVDCGGVTCPTDRPVCCAASGKPICAAADACGELGSRPEYRCSSPKHCPAKSTCQTRPLGGSACHGLLDIGNTSVACDVDADCRRDYRAACGNKAPKCARDPRPQMRVCSCP